MSEPNPFRDPLSDIPEMAASWTERLHRSTGSDKPKLPRQEVGDVRINTWSAYAPPPWGGACCLYRRKSSASEARTSRRSRRSVFSSAISSRVPRRLFAAIRWRILSANELLGSRPARTGMACFKTVRKVGETISDSGTRANFRGLWSIKARKIADSWIPRDVFWPAREFPHGLQEFCAAVCDVRFTSIAGIPLATSVGWFPPFRDIPGLGIKDWISTANVENGKRAQLPPRATVVTRHRLRRAPNVSRHRR
jgi:hypothetical protein